MNILLRVIDYHVRPLRCIASWSQIRQLGGCCAAQADKYIRDGLNLSKHMSRPNHLRSFRDTAAADGVVAGNAIRKSIPAALLLWRGTPALALIHHFPIRQD